jgi:hypothetical protein
MILDQNLGQSQQGQVKTDWIVTLSGSRMDFRIQLFQRNGPEDPFCEKLFIRCSPKLLFFSNAEQHFEYQRMWQ